MLCHLPLGLVARSLLLEEFRGRHGVQERAVLVALRKLLVHLALLALRDAQRILQPLQLVCLRSMR